MASKVNGSTTRKLITPPAGSNNTSRLADVLAPSGIADPADRTGRSFPPSSNYFQAPGRAAVADAPSRASTPGELFSTAQQRLQGGSCAPRHLPALNASAGHRRTAAPSP